MNELNVERFALEVTGRLKFSHPPGTHNDRLWAFTLAAYYQDLNRPNIIPSPPSTSTHAQANFSLNFHGVSGGRNQSELTCPALRELIDSLGDRLSGWFLLTGRCENWETYSKHRKTINRYREE
jgi:hypothetical protein